MSRLRRIVLVGTLILVAVIGFSQVALASGTQPPAKTLIIKKSVKTSYDRHWSWTITKKANQPGVTLDIGQVKSVDYSVIVRASSHDSGWAMSGLIQILNPTDQDATVTGVTDVADGVAADVVCRQGNTVINFPYVLKAGWSIACSYSASLPDGKMRLNVASVNTTGSVRGARTQAVVSFGAPSTETDECVDVLDEFTGSLGTVCRGNQAFGYSWQIGPYDACGTYKVGNAAKFITNDTGFQKVAVYVIDVNVVCKASGQTTETSDKQIDETVKLVLDQEPVKDSIVVEDELKKEDPGLSGEPDQTQGTAVTE